MHDAKSQDTTAKSFLTPGWLRESKVCHLGPNVFVTGGTNKGKANQKNIRLRVREWAKAVVIFLPCSVPETKRYGLPIDHHVGRIVIENYGHLEQPSSFEITKANQLVYIRPEVTPMLSKNDKNDMGHTGNAFVVYEIKRHV